MLRISKTDVLHEEVTYIGLLDVVNISSETPGVITILNSPGGSLAAVPIARIRDIQLFGPENVPYTLLIQGAPDGTNYITIKDDLAGDGVLINSLDKDIIFKYPIKITISTQIEVEEPATSHQIHFFLAIQEIGELVV